MRHMLVRGFAVAGLLAMMQVHPAHAAADKISMQFGWLPGGDRAFYYLAREAGFYRDENLDVSLLAGKGSTDAMTKVATGAAEFGEGGLDALLTAKVAADIPLIAVMPVYTSAPDALITTTATGIKSLKDVAGKKIATSPFTSSNGPWPFLLRLNGVDPDKVTLLKVDPSTLAPMLATGQADGVIQYVNNAPVDTVILDQVKKTMVMLPWSDYGLEGYSSSIFVSPKTLANRRDLVVRFTRALKKAELLLEQHPEQAADALVKSVPETDRESALAMAKATLPLMFNANTTRDGLGVFSPALVKTTLDWVAKQANVPTDRLDPMSAVDVTVAKDN